ncbi:TPA: restriction endonuclease subunit S, partial [Acinetobacter baumannii]
MSTVWNTYRIEDIADKITIGPFGSRMKSDAYVESGVPVIRGTNLTGSKKFSGDWVFISEQLAKQLENCCVSNGDLVFPHRGSIGEVGLVDNQFHQYMMSSSLMKLRCNPNIADSEFIYYFFKSHQGRYELLKNASQVGTPGIGQPLTSLKNIEIKLPSLGEQRKIAKILSDLDDKIHINNQINQTLESIAQALFKSWFVDFDPVRAKIAAKQEGKDAELAAMCAISGKSEIELQQMAEDDFAALRATAALFPDGLVESELGEVPKGWEVSTVGEQVQTVGGGTPSTKNVDFWDDGIHYWTTPKDLSNLTDKILLNTERKITDAGLKKISSGLLPKDTVLMSSRAPVGYLALSKIEVAINQ